MPPSPRNKDQSADAAKNHFYQSLFGGVRGNVPKFEKLRRIRFQSNHFGWNNYESTQFVPSHHTGCVEMVVNSSMNSRGNGRPMLNRFVLDKSHPRMRYDVWFLTFSGSLHSA